MDQLHQRPTVRQLECALAVLHHENFSRAAESLFLSQPALSAQVKQLEELLGAQLFERGRHGALVTPVGRELLARARQVLDEADGLVELARAATQPFCGDLRLGVIPTVAPYMLPHVMPAIAEVYPDLRLVLREDQTDRLVAACEAGELDLLLLALDVELGRLSELELFEDAFLLAAPEGHPALKRKYAREADLVDARLLLLDEGHCLRDHALAVCRLAAADARDSFGAASLSTLLRMVATGMGITLLPAMAQEREAPSGSGIGLRPFRKEAGHSLPHRRIGLAWRPTSARADEFAALGDLIRDTVS